MHYLLAAYTVTLLVLGLAAWRLRSGLAGAEADLAALGQGSDERDGGESRLPAAGSGDGAGRASST